MILSKNARMLCRTVHTVYIDMEHRLMWNWPDDQSETVPEYAKKLYLATTPEEPATVFSTTSPSKTNKIRSNKTSFSSILTKPSPSTPKHNYPDTHGSTENKWVSCIVRGFSDAGWHSEQWFRFISNDRLRDEMDSQWTGRLKSVVLPNNSSAREIYSQVGVREQGRKCWMYCLYRACVHLVGYGNRRSVKRLIFFSFLSVESFRWSFAWPRRS